MSSIPAVEGQPRRGKLLQVLGVGFGLAVTVGNTIGAGIVRTPGEVAAQLPDPWLFLGVWVAGGLYALVGTAQLTELTAMVRRSGGQYTFALRALGHFPGFLVGWSDFVSVSGTTALVSIVIGEYSAALVPALAGREAWVATAVVLLFGVIQWRGVRWGSGTQNLTAAAKGFAFVALVAACFFFGSRSTGDAAPAAAMPSGLAFAVAMIFALQSVIYTYDGWNGTTYFAEEVHDPDRNIPRAMFGGILSVMGIYVLVNLALVWLLPISAIAGNNFALGAAAGVVFGPLGDPLVRGVMILSMLSGINAYHLMSSRVLFAMSRDGYFSERIVRVNEGGTPTLALGVSVAVALLLIWTGTFNRVLSLCALLFVLQYVASFISLFVLRRREPDAPRPYWAWGYPWSTGFVLLGSLGFVVGVIASDTRNSIYSLVMLALSYPVYRLLKRAAVPSQ
jgi:APA family basic amino acid/polyamine antiporter